MGEGTLGAKRDSMGMVPDVPWEEGWAGTNFSAKEREVEARNLQVVCGRTNSYFALGPNIAHTIFVLL